jgi:hypothetical protein
MLTMIRTSPIVRDAVIWEAPLDPFRLVPAEADQQRQTTQTNER